MNIPTVIFARMASGYVQLKLFWAYRMSKMMDVTESSVADSTIILMISTPLAR